MTFGCSSEFSTSTRVERPQRSGRTLAFALLAIWSVALFSCGDDEPLPEPGSQTVAELRVVRDPILVKLPGSGEAEESSAFFRLPAGSTVTSDDGRAMLAHDTGLRVLLGEHAEVKVQASSCRLRSGRAWVEALPGARTTTRAGDVEVSTTGAGYELRVDDQGTHIYVLRGSVYYDAGKRQGEVRAGYEATIGGGETEIEAKGLWDDWTGGLAWPKPAMSGPVPGVGEIGARRPGSSGKARFPLVIRSLKVRSVVRDDLVITKVDQEFFNPVSEKLEGIYRIRLPKGALLQSFGIDRDGKMVYGYIKERQKARAQYSAQVYQGSTDDPALLAWEAPGLYKAQIYPIPPGSTRKVSIVYTEWLRRDGERRTWRYPLSGGGRNRSRIGELDVAVNVVDAGTKEIDASLGAKVEKGEVTLTRSDHVPRADLVLTLRGRREADSRTTGYRVTGKDPKEGDFFLTRVFPLPVAKNSSIRRPIDVVIVADVSAGTDPTRLHLARTVADALLRHLNPKDRVAVVGGDLTLHGVDGKKPKLVSATRANIETLLDGLSDSGVGGATDLGSMLTGAAGLLETNRQGGVVYLGDGAPTVGELDLEQLRKRFSRLPSPFRFYGVAVGPEANLDLLAGLASDGGLATRVEDRAEAARASLDILANLNRPVLHRVKVDLGPSLERVYPRRPVSVVAGEPLVVVGRIRRDGPKELELTAQLKGEKLSRTYRLNEKKLEDAGDLRLRWASSRLDQLLNDGAGREEMVELGTRFDLITPYTSFYVPSAREIEENSDERKKVDQAELEASETSKTFSKADKKLEQAKEQAAAQPAKSSPRKRESGPVDAVEESGEAMAAPQKPRPRPGRARFRKKRPAGSLNSLLGGSGRGGERTASSSVRADGASGIGGGGSLSGFRRRRGLSDKDGHAAPRTEEKARIQDDLRALQGVKGRSSRVGRIGRVTRIDVNIKIDINDHRPKRCSPASEKPLGSRKALWRERLRAHGRSLRTALMVWQDALQRCELRSWRDRRALLGLMLDRLGSVGSMLRLYRHFRRRWGAARYLRRAIMGRVRTAKDLKRVLEALGMSEQVKWSMVEELLARLDDPKLRLQTIRKLLAEHPRDARLKRLLLETLEKTRRVDEAMLLVGEVEGNPYADADFRVAAAEFLLRRGEKHTIRAKRILSEMVEFRPKDPAVRRRLGDLYRAYGWHSEAYRQYQTLASLLPQDSSVLLLMAAAAAGSGRIDEALRLEQRVAGTAEPGSAEGLAKWALLWSSVRLMKLRWEARTEGEEARERLTELLRRTRRSGVLSLARPFRVVLTWSHPSADVELYVGAGSYRPSRPSLLGTLYGIEAYQTKKVDPDGYTVEVRRVGRDSARVVEADLMIIWNEGKPDEKLWSKKLVFDSDDNKARFRVEGAQVKKEELR
jgi:Ca-activated chloride channel family protein